MTLEQLEGQEDATLKEIVCAFEQVIEKGGSFNATAVNRMLIRATERYKLSESELRGYKYRFLAACQKGIVNCNQPGSVNEIATIGLLRLMNSVQL